MSSHRTVHYGLRPSKNIERKMICEVFQRLSHFNNLNEYRYVGFGSRYFSDFMLVHKTLGIHNMISIERDSSNKDWFEFNRPYKCIAPLYNHSSQVLPTLKWDIPTILWLDYDGKLDIDALFDIGCFCSSAKSGSIVLATVNANSSGNEDVSERLSQLGKDVGEGRIPTNIKVSDLGLKGKPKVYHLIFARNRANRGCFYSKWTK